MKVTVRGWARDMGEKELSDIDLSDIQYSRDRIAHRAYPVLYSRFEGPEVAWCQAMKYIGDYRMQVQFSQADILRLFKMEFGTELGADLLQEHGFTMSPELVQAALKTVKLADLTLGDLIKMHGESKPAPEQKTEEPEKIRPFLRRV